ncbi:MAG: HK97 family phage prohead protease [Planctomycetota bacterium]
MQTDKTPPHEVRLTTEPRLEVRASDDNRPPKLIGYAAVFDSLSTDLGGFRERIKPGAFAEAIAADGADVRALVDHDPGKLLGRTANNTLTIAEDAHGLRVEVELPDTSYARDLRTMIDRGDIAGMSFGFVVPKNGDSFARDGQTLVRELHRIDLHEVTVTSIPAYGDTTVSVRVAPSVRTRAEESADFPRRAIANRRLKVVL